MVSLRARLLAALLALAGGGLLLLGGVTYAEQRSFLFDRSDQQVRSAIAPIGHALDDERSAGGALGVGAAPRRGGPGGGSPGGPGGDRRGRGEHGPQVGLPPGTYGEHRTAAGTTVGSPVVLDYGQSVTSRPSLPRRVPTGKAFTVRAVGGDDLRYRVLAEQRPGSTELTVVAVPLRDVDATLHRLLAVEGLVIAVVLAVLGLLAWFVVRIGLRPLDRMGTTAGAIAGGDLSHRVEAVHPGTEVGRLGIALNAMLDRLEQAFAQRQASEERLRRFIADASHELRTPLASIRGYAELMRMGAVEDPDEAATAMRRIEEESARMGVLVEELLTLARLDAMPEVPHEPVDLAMLARDAAKDTRAMAPDRAISVRTDPSATVLGNGDQLRQVLANLLRNAVVHTPAGTPIEITVAAANGEVGVAVRDHGPGLPTDNPEDLFERFWRAEGGRARGRAGAGLGLAIVGVIVDAHRGRVQATNAEGGGAVFAVHLPRRD